MVARDRDADANSGNGLEERIYPTHDASFNVTALLDDEGTVLQRIRYTPHGESEVLNASWTPTSDAYVWLQRFQGGRWETRTGIVYFRYRDYSTNLKTWMQVDPIRYSDSANLYLGFGSNPVNLTDAMGLSPMLPTTGDPVGPPGKRIVADSVIEQDVVEVPADEPTNWWGIGADVAGVFFPVVDVAQAIGSAWEGDWWGAGINAIGVVPVFGDAAKIAAKAARGAKAVKTVRCPPSVAKKIGKEGERAAGISSGPKIGIEIPSTGRYRFPDEINEAKKIIKEVKNRIRVDLSKQLRDYIEYAKANGYRVELYIRPSTKLSGPLRELVDKGIVTIKNIPGAK
jgi:RHS repeat-associated protein